LLDVDRAEVDGRTLDAFEAAQRLVVAESTVNLAYVYLGVSALRANRPRVAIDAFSHSTKRSLPEATQVNAAGFLTQAYHDIGDHAEELAQARIARKAYPENPGLLFFELRALAACDRISEMEPLSARLERASSPQARIPELLMAIAGELSYHGHPIEARRVLERAVEWQRARSPRENQDAFARYTLGSALYFLGRYTEADSLFEALAREHPHDPVYLASRGASAGRLGKATIAEGITEQLSRLHPSFDRGQTPYSLAQLAAQRGDTIAALAFLEQSFREGRSQSGLHSDLMLSPLWRDARFKELLQPKE
jgi:tetratricopeptide (TPR) repeat protein